MANRQHAPWIILLVAAVFAVAACSYEPTTNPVARKFSWFSYLDGEDIRRACVPGAPDRYRLVYNGVYTEQVRAYDVTPAAEAGRYEIQLQVTERADLSSFTLDRSRPDLLKPWRPEVSRTNLSVDEVAVLERVMDADDVFGPPPVGMEMASHEFYWAVAACRNGAYHFNAFRWPGRRFEQLRFPKLLATWDFSGIPVNPPRAARPEEVFQMTDDREFLYLFHVKVSAEGLNRPRLFQ